jgi:hypothetical protein
LAVLEYIAPDGRRAHPTAVFAIMVDVDLIAPQLAEDEPLSAANIGSFQLEVEPHQEPL